jgi:hypothetical protein
VTGLAERAKMMEIHLWKESCRIISVCVGFVCMRCTELQDNVCAKAKRGVFNRGEHDVEKSHGLCSVSVQGNTKYL